jgi:putative peptide zinc metalloprotease protein
VTLRRQVLGGETFYLVRHPETYRFYRFRETEHALLQLLDGTSTIPELAVRFSEAHGQVKEETVETFVDSLRQLDLLERPPEERNIALYERIRAYRARRRMPMANVLVIKKKLYDPDRFFSWVLRWLGFCWTGSFVRISSVAAVVAAIVVFLEWPAFSSDFKAFLASFVDPSHFLANYLFVLGTWFWLAVVHESCHGVTCKYFGGEVHEVGFILFYLQFPGAYTNVNDAWGFEKRYQRIWVTLAGAYSELVLSTLAVFVWWVVPRGTFLHREALAVILLGFVGNIFGDFNPLVKFDGYYILSDYLEVPNLQGNSWKHVGYLFRRHLLRLPVQPQPATARTRRVYSIFGTLSFAYIGLLMMALLVFMGAKLHDKLGGVGLALFALPAFTILRRPGMAVASTARFFWSDKREALLSPRGIRRVLVAGAALAAVLFLPLLPDRISGEGLVEPVRQEAIRAGAPGTVAEVLVEPGEKVRAGQPVVRLVNPLLRRQAAVQGAAVRERRGQAAAAEARGRPEEAALLQAGLAEALHAAERMDLRVGRLEVRAPEPGVLDAPDLRHALGRFVRQGEILGRVFLDGPLQVRVRIPERLLAGARVDMAARLKTPSLPGRVFSGRVVSILPERAPDDAAEQRAVQQDPTVQPQAFYWVLTEFEDPRGLMRPGTTARVRLERGRRSFAEGLLRMARRLLGGKLWLW